MLVVDASAAWHACASPEGFAPFGREPLFAPPLLWSEVSSSLHEALWRGEVSRKQAAESLARLEGGRLRARSPRGLLREAWRVSEELGWAKTYDAEYVALARLLRCRLVTLDERLRKAAGRIIDVVGPLEL